MAVDQPIPWTELRSAAEVEAAVLERLGPSPTAASLFVFATEQEMACSGLLDDGSMRCSAPAGMRSDTVRATWLLHARFDGDALADLMVEEGLTGP